MKLARAIYWIAFVALVGTLSVSFDGWRFFAVSGLLIAVDVSSFMTGLLTAKHDHTPHP